MSYAFTLPDHVASAVETLAAKAGMSGSSWLADQVTHAFGTGRIALDPEKPRRLSRSARRRRAARARIDRAAKAAGRDEGGATCPTS